MLLGFARYITARGFLLPPCSLPTLPPQAGNSFAAQPGLGAKATPGQTNIFPSPVLWQLQGSRSNPIDTTPSWSLGDVQQPDGFRARAGVDPPRNKTLAYGNPIETGLSLACGGAKWLSPGKHLCEGCWAAHSGSGSVIGTRCPRCGRQQRGRLAHGQHTGNRAEGGMVGEEISDKGAVPWQRFSQVGVAVYIPGLSCRGFKLVGLPRLFPVFVVGPFSFSRAGTLFWCRRLRHKRGL